MKDEHLDNIMEKQIKYQNTEIDIKQAVMYRIEEYEERKSRRIVYWEYIFSGLIFISGLLSIFIIQYIFNSDIFSVFGKWLNLYISAIRWISTIVFASIIISVIYIILAMSSYKTEKKMLQKHV